MKKTAIVAAALLLGVAAYWPYKPSQPISNTSQYDPGCEAKVRKIQRRQAEYRNRSEMTLVELWSEFGNNSQDVKETSAYMIDVSEAQLRDLPCYTSNVSLPAD